jgi:hypothetical protein
MHHLVRLDEGRSLATKGGLEGQGCLMGHRQGQATDDLQERLKGLQELC